MHHSQTFLVGDETFNQNFSLQYDLILYFLDGTEILTLTTPELIDS